MKINIFIFIYHRDMVTDFEIYQNQSVYTRIYNIQSSDDYQNLQLTTNMTFDWLSQIAM